MAHALASPEFKVSKTYRLKIKGRASPPELERLRRGVDIGGYVTAPAQMRELSSGPANMWLQITLVEGKYRQIKRMLEAVGHRVVRLLRERFGPLELGGLRPGEWRHLTDAEVRALRELVRAK
jgi:pseudouridine synthase